MSRVCSCWVFRPVSCHCPFSFSSSRSLQYYALLLWPCSSSTSMNATANRILASNIFPVYSRQNSKLFPLIQFSFEIYRSLTFLCGQTHTSNEWNTPRGQCTFRNNEPIHDDYMVCLLIKARAARLCVYVCVCIRRRMNERTIELSVDFETFPDQFSEKLNFPRKQINLKQF